MKKYLLTLFVLVISFSVFFSDNIYLQDGTKLIGKILNFNEVTVDVILESGKLINVNKDEIIRIDPVDAESLDSQDYYIPPFSGLENSAVEIPTSQISNMTGIEEIPVMYGDPEMEMRKRLLMYSEMKKESWVAAELSLLIPSAGHLYTGEWERGFLFLGAKAAFGGLALWGLYPVNKVDAEGVVVTDDSGNPIQAPQNTTLGAIGVGGFALFALLEFVDSYYAAERYNQVLRLRLGIEKFDPMMLPTFSK